MIEIIKDKSIEIFELVKKSANSIGNNNVDKSEIQSLGLGHSSTMDLFNQRGNRTQSGLFIIDWGEEAKNGDD
jgi:hypothetical protein